MRKIALTALMAFGSVGTAQAASPPSITFTPGVYTIPAYSTATVVENFERGVAGTTYNPATQSQGVDPEATTGSVNIFQGSVPGRGYSPDFDNNKYAAIDNGTFTIGLGAGAQFFSFVFGSLDTYNSLQLFYADGTSQLLTGLGIISGAAANTPAGTPAATLGQTGRVSYNANGGPAFTAATFGSSQAAFEIDDIATAAPEPATWAFMILGFGIVGSALRVRRRRASVSLA